MNALTTFLRDNPIVLLICFIGAGLTIYEFVRYQLGWKVGIVSHLWERHRESKALMRESPAMTGPTEAPDALDASPIVDRTGQPVRVDDREFTTWVKRSLVHRFDGYGQQARYDFFEQRRRESPPSDLHRTAFLNLMDRREFAALGEGLKEWCKIGFDTLVHTTPILQTEDTMNRLHVALLNELQTEQLRIQGSREFAYEWAELVRQYRSDGY